MPNNNRLDPLRKLADIETRDRSREMADRLFQLRAEEQRLEQLENYLREYAGIADGNGTVNASALESRQAFYQRLKDCVDQQSELVHNLCTQMERYMAHWSDARSRSLAFEKYADRVADRRAERSSRREQSRIDESAQQQFSRKD